MGTGLAVLITLLAFVTGASAASPTRCLSCHPAHYVDRGGCTVCHHGDNRSSRVELAHAGLIAGQYASFANRQAAAVVAGKQLIERSACRRCHTTAGSGNRLAANLDTLLWTTAPDKIRLALTAPATYMPRFYFSQQDLDLLVTAILAGGHQSGKLHSEPPQVVHFNSTGTMVNPFVKHCGGCHKLLSTRHGALGSSEVGPNLSGLLGRYYPASFVGTHAWTEQRLKRWLTNPRSVKPFTAMRPVNLKAAEFGHLVRLFASSN